VTGFQRASGLTLVVLFGLAFLMGLAEMLRGRAVRRTTMYGSLVAAVAVAGYLIFGGN
jgi:hypothetical protein